MKFLIAVKPEPNLQKSEGYVFAFQGDQLLVLNGEDRCQIPTCRQFAKLDIAYKREHYLGLLDDKPCFSVDLDDEINCPQSAALVGLREVFGVIKDTLFSVAGHAFQIVTWDRMHQYCGRCGALTDYALDVRAKICYRCEAVYYPRISPVIIVAVSKGHELLLIKNKRHRRNFYSVIAGFVEPGESLEECLVREVREETAIEVKNINYFASQSWPFPNALMVGFTAEYASGILRPDGVEIAEAGWFSPDNFPELPGPISIARKLIDAFVQQQANSKKE